MNSALGLSLGVGGVASTMIGESAAMHRLREMIGRVAQTRLSVLVQGPTGAGKELVAAAIHSESNRRGAFIPFNVCAISESMFEDALFGHVRGAFTGAHQDTAGFLREAHGGTVFLDEISGLPLALQAKLLRALETGVFRPVGARRDVHSDFRVVAATNERIDSLVMAGSFRGDLAHRIGAVVLQVPSLAERVEDIPLLALHFLERVSAQSQLSSAVRNALAAHPWTGNVRELKHVVECAAALGRGRLTLDSLHLALDHPVVQQVVHVERDARERQALERLLESHAWNTDLAARNLGVHRATLYRRMKRLGIPLRRGMTDLDTDSQRIALA